MNRPPRDPKDPLISAAFLRRILFVSVLIGAATLLVFWWEYNYGGISLAQAQGTAVTMLALGQLVYLFNCRFLDRSSITPAVLRGNPTLWWSAGALILLQVAFLYLPFMQELFRVEGIALREWGLTFGVSLVIFLIVETAKALGRRNQRLAVRRA